MVYQELKQDRNSPGSFHKVIIVDPQMHTHTRKIKNIIQEDDNHKSI